MKLGHFSALAIFLALNSCCLFNEDVTVKIATSNEAPQVFESVVLDGSKSETCSGVKSYFWRIEGKPSESYLNRDADLDMKKSTLEFIPDEPGIYRFSLEVTSNKNHVGSEEIIVEAKQDNPASGGGNEIVLTVPFAKQYPPGTAFSMSKNCGPACVLMVYGYFKKMDGITDDFAQNYIKSEDNWLLGKFSLPINNYNGSVTNSSHLISLLKEFTNAEEDKEICDAAIYLTDMSYSKVKEYLEGNRPIIAVTNLYGGHWVVIKGISDDSIIINDPGKTVGENKAYPLSSFARIWNKSGIVVSKNPNLLELLYPSPSITVSQGTYRDRIQCLISHVENATGYEIEYATDSTFTTNKATLYFSDLYPSANTLVDFSATPGVIYYYRAKAYKRDGNGKTIAESRFGPIASGYRGN